MATVSEPDHMLKQPVLAFSCCLSASSKLLQLFKELTSLASWYHLDLHHIKVDCVKQVLGLKMRQVCFVEKETFLADKQRHTFTASASPAKLLKVCKAWSIGHKHALPEPA